MWRTLAVTGLAALSGTPIGAQESLLPLFRDHAPLHLTIAADFEQLLRDRSQDSEERDGSITFGDGVGASVPVKIRTRGRFRLQSRICAFPPLRLNVPKGAVEGTVLEGQDKFKLVTHCRDRDGYEANALEEYLVYRLLNQLTDRSFQVRLARLTYVDTSGREETRERWGFLIESDEALAERLGGTLMDEEVEVPIRDFRGRNTGLISLFQFMVGNTDWSMGQHHNFVLVRTPDDIVPVPYDFDWTGFVDAPYARPDSTLRIRSVRDRVYREPCRFDIDYHALFTLFRERRGALEAEIRGVPGLDERSKAEALEYLDEFYAVLNDPEQTRSRIVEGCRAV